MADSAETTDRGLSRPRLTREKVLRAALDFVDANGLAALSMHKLGAELGVQGMSLYSHVENKDALLDGIVEAMTREAQPPPADELSRMRRVTEMAPRDAPDHPLRLAMLFCGRCDTDVQFNLGVELMIRGLDGQDGEPGC